MSAFARFAAATLACGVLVLSLPALAEAKKDKTDKDSAKPALVATYGDWSVYQNQAGKSRICYTLASPKSRDPDDDKRQPAYAFISERPAEQVRNEVSFVMGFEVAAAANDAGEKSDAKDKGKKKSDKEKKSKAETAVPTAAIGDNEFELLPKGTNLWVKNAAQESQLIEAMRHGGQLKVHASPRKGEATTDSYSLTGFKQAIDRALKDCPAS